MVSTQRMHTPTIHHTDQQQVKQRHLSMRRNECVYDSGLGGRRIQKEASSN